MFRGVLYGPKAMFRGVLYEKLRKCLEEFCMRG